jgi:hypothetical protein
MSEKKVRSTFAKNGRESIVMSESEYKGFDLIDIRTFYVDAAGELAPTRKGITIRAEKLKDFIATLTAFSLAVEERSMEESGEEAEDGEYDEFVKSLPMEA